MLRMYIRRRGMLRDAGCLLGSEGGGGESRSRRLAGEEMELLTLQNAEAWLWVAASRSPPSTF